MRRHDLILRAIALFRLAKAILLVAGGFAALHMLRPGVAEHVRAWIDALPWASQHRIVRIVAARLTSLPPDRIELAAAAAFSYALLFTAEGTGLWLLKKWAEYLTIIATTSFIPFEVWEVTRKMSAVRVAILAANVAIVIYLVVHRWRRGAGS